MRERFDVPGCLGMMNVAENEAPSGPRDYYSRNTASERMCDERARGLVARRARKPDGNIVELSPTMPLKPGWTYVDEVPREHEQAERSVDGWAHELRVGTYHTGRRILAEGEGIIRETANDRDMHTTRHRAEQLEALKR